MSARAPIAIDRTIPLWGLLTTIGALVATGAGAVWNLSAIAHDVGEVKQALQSIQAKEDGRDARVQALEVRVVKLEASAAYRRTEQ
ncbi:Uncharacterised protein [Burkholderia pseudomallei]|uniref:hypothetical protein n=1 Tax=Burkholderia pseudomallei TaxID=28450 RepID=UPI0007182E44|nr:hypothetical protein [Burkholderia pseudomallei]OMQ80256.1 hypothetical protein AQ714_06710 [Burkholderia pseudomallei]CAJ2887202.1 Uncharacterised protein [Burkholderia pseudomallei]CAJ2959318.1 Uncharacterised protein [Burkholderia pseudomallei]VBE33200.1 Uncharacterised protein [Burkholderia pseudomallei]VBG70024.1 Uncharacterised protein [Burkholderia pseudomallei]